MIASKQITLTFLALFCVSQVICQVAQEPSSGPGPISAGEIPNIPIEQVYTGLANGCFWEKCESETKAFSTYFGGLTYEGKSKIGNLYKTCSKIYTDDVREQCEKSYNYSTYTDSQFVDFYKCIIQCFQVSLDSCREENEKCSFCLSDETCTATTYKGDKTKTDSLTQAVNGCEKSNETACPSTLAQVAQDSCKSYGKKVCTDEWMSKNVSEDDPCYTCVQTAFISKISFSLALFFTFAILF